MSGLFFPDASYHDVEDCAYRLAQAIHGGPSVTTKQGGALYRMATELGIWPQVRECITRFEVDDEDEIEKELAGLARVAQAILDDAEGVA